MKVEGRCHCGAITYEAEADPTRVTVCHCTDCQQLSGTAFRTSLPAAPGTFVIVTGVPKVYVKTADNGNRRAQAFCGDCSSPVYSASADDPRVYTLRVGCLAQRAQLPPLRRIWCRSALAWSADMTLLPAISTQPAPAHG